MKIVLIFGCLILFFQNTRGDWEHPHYSFRCHESQQDGIDIFGLHDHTIVTITNGTSDPACVSTKQYTKTGEKLNLPYTCTNSLQENSTEIGRFVGIHVMDNSFDGSETSIPHIVGGHSGHNFIIICKNIQDDGIEKTVAKVFQGGPHVLPVNNKEVSSVEMHFRATNDINAPDISEIYIGDAFYMFLEYTGEDSRYWIKPEKCEAYKGTVPPMTKDRNMLKITLWVGSVRNSSEKCEKHKELLSSMERKVFEHSKSAVVAAMYGFKFQNSEYITVTCNVVIHSPPVETNLCKNTTRRRRDTLQMRREMLDTPFQRKSITGKLKVYDHSSEYSNSANNFQGSFGCFMLSWGIMIVFVLLREFC